jgi:hypothetical protein
LAIVDDLKTLEPIAGKPDAHNAPLREFLSAVYRKCPRCGAAGSLSHRKGKYETFILPITLRRPLRCKACRRRFYGFDLSWNTIRQAMVVLGAVAVLAYFLWRLVVGVISPDLDFH